MKIGIILGSIREGRLGDQVAEWVLQQAQDRSEADYEVIDPKAFNLPMLTAPTPPGRADRQYDSEEVTRWSQAVDACDGYVFITPEYNHGVPGALKNAFDSLSPEWQGKAIGFVSYGADNGVRAVEHWRAIVSNLSMVDIRQQGSYNLFTEFGENGFTPGERRPEEIQELFNQLEAAVRRQQA